MQRVSSVAGLGPSQRLSTPPACHTGPAPRFAHVPLPGGGSKPRMQALVPAMIVSDGLPSPGNGAWTDGSVTRPLADRAVPSPDRATRVWSYAGR
jgi:hypothetical protein